MRKFIWKLILIITSSVISIAGVYVFMASLSKNMTGLAREVFFCIDKAEVNSGVPSVILGDSVCNQLWPQKEDSPNVTHLACNQAITPAGTYLLLNKYLQHNPQTREVFYIVRPQTLGNDLNLNYTYQYFVIPFVNDESIKLLDYDTITKLYERFGKFFVLNDYAKQMLLNNNLLMQQYLNHVRHKSEQTYNHRLSPTAIIYLRKINALCSELNISLHVLPLPVPDTESNHGWELFSDDIKAYGLSGILGNFTEMIHYCPDEWYRDGSHFKPDVLKEHISELRNIVMNP